MPFDPGPWHQAWQLLANQVEGFEDFLEEEWKTSMNAIAEIREFDCGGEWAVYVRTALPSVAAALWLLLVPSLDEILEEYLNPKQGRGGSRRGRRAERRWRMGNRGQRRLFFSNFLPDIDEEIAKRLPGGDAVRGRRIGPGEWLFWTAIDVADRIAWQYLIWEASQTFLTTWQSELMEANECRTSGDAYIMGNYDSSGLGLIATFFDDAEDITVAERVNFNQPDAGKIQVVDGKQVDGFLAISNSCTLDPGPDPVDIKASYRRTVEIVTHAGEVIQVAEEVDHIDTVAESPIQLTELNATAEVAGLVSVQTDFQVFNDSITGAWKEIRQRGNFAINGNARDRE
jgi:hypothetical protein